MEKLELIRIVVEVLVAGALLYFGPRAFKYKGTTLALLRAIKDMTVTEAECQEIADAIKKDIYGEDQPLPASE